MKNKFLEKVAEQIEDERSRELITAELESHLLDKIDYYIDIGYSREEAESVPPTKWAILKTRLFR